MPSYFLGENTPNLMLPVANSTLSLSCANNLSRNIWSFWTICDSRKLEKRMSCLEFLFSTKGDLLHLQVRPQLLNHHPYRTQSLHPRFNCHLAVPPLEPYRLHLRA